MAESQRATPPADIEAEQALVGAYILDRTVGERVSISAADFYRPAHETMWTVLTGLNGEDHDRSFALLDGLRQRGELRGHLTGAYVHSCLSACTTPAAAEQYARAVRNTARLRRSIQALQKGLQRITSVDIDDIDGALYEAQDDLDNILREATSKLDLTTWEPLTLDRVLEGSELDPPPCLLMRSDGAFLLYAGAVHVFAGEPGAGKTFLSLYCVRQELLKGNPVTFVDFEDRASRVVGHLLDLGATPAQIRELFTYIRPNKPITDVGRHHLEHAITGSALVIIDGVTEAMTMHGLSLKDNEDIARFYALLPRWVADHGPAVVLIDHVVKDADAQGRWAIGGGHKIAGTDGVAYTIREIERFGRGKIGSSRIVISRDRPGYIEDIALGKTAGIFRIDSTLPNAMVATVDAPDPMPTTEGGGLKPTKLMRTISLYLSMNPGASKSQIETGVHGAAKWIRVALQALIEGGYVVTEQRGNAVRHILEHHYDPDNQETL